MNDAETHKPSDLDDVIDLVERLRDTLAAAATPNSMNDRPNGDAYKTTRRALIRRLEPLGIRDPFPWGTVEEGVAAAKFASGNYQGRRKFFGDRAERIIEILRRRKEDQDAGDIAGALSDFGDTATGLLTSPAAIRAELVRLEASLPLDPSATVGKAKNLVEATAKAVLLALSKPVNDHSDINEHVVAVMVALGVDNKSVAEHDRDLAKIMSQLNGLTVALANWRNHAGDAHALSTGPVGLDLRHGRLAVRAALAWCGFILDTLHDQSP
jgi:hypothetical protein